MSVSASPYEGWPLTRGLNCRVLVEKLLGPQFGVCLWEVSVGEVSVGEVSVGEVSAYGRRPLGRCPLGEVSAYGRCPLGRCPLMGGVRWGGVR